MIDGVSFEVYLSRMEEQAKRIQQQLDEIARRCGLQPECKKDAKDPSTFAA